MIAKVARRVAPCVAATLAVFSVAHADDDAEAYVAGILDEANVVFAEADEKTRFDGIDALVDKYVDMPKVARFALGQYARVITDEQNAAYQPLFRAYAKTVYRKTLSEYSGQRLEVSGSIDRSERDIIVNTSVVGAAPSDPLADVTVSWRVYRDKEGEHAIVDAGAEGVWLAIEQQSQFKSVIANNGGGAKGVDALIADLKAKVGG